ncbi:MAG: hypothetical protein WC911_02115 [Thermoleophilia bacterium]
MQIDKWQIGTASAEEDLPPLPEGMAALSAWEPVAVIRLEPDPVWAWRRPLEIDETAIREKLASQRAKEEQERKEEQDRQYEIKERAWLKFGALYGRKVTYNDPKAEVVKAAQSIGVDHVGTKWQLIKRIEAEMIRRVNL